jgi:MoaA/NifB/PqqE/SkfB family radical SAM enzyme
MTYRQLEDLTAYTKSKGVEHIALATNGSFPLNLYRRLIDLGVDDFAVSLDACCSLVGKAMSGGVGDWERVVSNIRSLSKLTHTSVGIVLNEGNIAQGRQTIQFAQDLGVADIRVIPSSQYNHSKAELYDFSEEVIARYPFLKFRSDNFKVGKTIRGLSNQDSNRCYFVQDDMIVANSWHYPCVIYMREGGNPIGKLGSDFRQQRVAWSKAHNCFSDPICSAYCLDLYRQYNVRANELCTE